MKKRKMVAIALLLICIVVPNSAHAAMPPADGIDVGKSMPQERASNYSYLGNFSVGVYLNDQKEFSRSFGYLGEPFFTTSHKKVNDNDPNTYRVSYQLLDIGSGNVINGVTYANDVSDKKTIVNIQGYDKFLAYIAGDGVNRYEAWGKLTH